MKNRLQGGPSQQVARETGEVEELLCGVLFRSIAYPGVPITGVPFDASRGVFPNREGRVVDGEDVVPGLY